MKIILSIISFFPFIMLAQSPIDSLIYHVNKGNNHKIIHFTEESKKLLDKNGVNKLDEKYLVFDFYLAKSLLDLQYYRKGEEVLLKTIESRKKNKTHFTKDQALTLLLLADYYVNQFNYTKAEALYFEIESICNKNNLKETSFYANTLRMHAHSFIKQDSLVAAEKYLKESINVYNNRPESYDEDILKSYYDLSDVYISRKLFVEAKDVLDIMLQITDNKKELNSYYYQILDLYTEYYLGINNIEKAEGLLEESIRKKISDYGKDSKLLIDSYNILFDISIRKSDFKKAENSLNNNLRLIELIYGKHSKQYYAKLLTASAFYIEQYPDNKKASEFLIKFSLEFKDRLKNVAAYYSNEEMDLYINNNFYLRFFHLSFIHSANENYPKNNTEIFEIETLVKKFTLKNNQLTKRIIDNSDNEDLKILYKSYINNKREYSNLNGNISKENIDQLENEIEKEEKKISALTFEFKQPEIFRDDTFDEIKEKLNNDEVIVDLLNFYYFDNKSGDNSKGVFDAFIIKNNSESPIFIKLFDDLELDSILEKQKNNIKNINEVYEKLSFYELFIKPLNKELKNISTLYIVLSGNGSLINFSAIPVSETLTLGEKYNVHLLGSSDEIIKYLPTKFKNKKSFELLLYGDIDYSNINLENTKSIKQISSLRSDDFVEYSNRSGITNWGYLPGTKLEIKNIKAKSTIFGFTAQIINDRNATKTSILNLDGKETPFVLHLATHGFFFEGDIKEIPNNQSAKAFKRNYTASKSTFYKSSKDPMLRTGLLFSGVNKYWGKPSDPSAIDDGILTAKEISNIDLSACQLVVLSACETGLGELNGSEGVYGLQRAFKMAGVKNIIMSLWKVPDAQTAELFELFYQHCFEGKSIHEALKLAQTEMKTKYTPYYWAGFVLLE